MNVKTNSKMTITMNNCKMRKTKTIFEFSFHLKVPLKVIEPREISCLNLLRIVLFLRSCGENLRRSEEKLVVCGTI